MKKILIILPLVIAIALQSEATLSAQEAGDFNIRYGLAARDRPRDPNAGRASQRGTLTFGVNFTPRISFGMNLNTFISKKNASGMRLTGLGDTFLNLDGVIVEEVIGEARPSVSLSYTIKLPTGNKDKGLGTGRVDHQILSIIRKTIDDAEKGGGRYIFRRLLWWPDWRKWFFQERAVSFRD